MLAGENLHLPEPCSEINTSIPSMRTPCDEALIRPVGPEAPCAEAARAWILTATILGSSMAFIDSTVVNVALPAIQASFHGTVGDVQWVVESYGLFLGAWILVGGSLGDLFGRRLMFLLGVVIFAMSSLACGLASTMQQLIIARSIQGLGAALLVPGSLTIISASFEEKNRGQAIGTWSGFTAITAAIGPVLGGWLVEHASWRWAFFINVPVAAAVVAIALWRVPESRGKVAGRIDWWGATFASLGLGGLVYGFIESVSLGWINPLVFGSVLAGSACLVAFAFVEAGASSPMVPLMLFRSPSFSGANLLTLLLYSAIGIFFFLLPLNLIQVQGYSATAAGGALLPLILLMFCLSRWAGGLVDRYGARLPLTVGPLSAALGFVLFALPSVGDRYWTSFFPALVILGLGMTVTVAPLTTVVMNSVDQDRVGAASGINNAVARIAGVLAIAVLGIAMVKAFTSHLDHSLAQLPLPDDTLRELHAGEVKLAGLQVPTSLNPGIRTSVKEAIEAAFVFGFRIVMFLCAALAVASAAVARLMIPNSLPKRAG